MIRDKLKKYLKSVYGFLNPTPVVGGLEISDSFVNYAEFRNGELIKVSVQLPTGVISGGKIIDEKVFSDILAKLKHRIESRREKLSVILTLPASLIFNQVTTIPQVERRNLKEVIDLNIKMASPMDLGAVYHDYELIDRSGRDGKGILLLTSFINKDIANKYFKSIEEANFDVVAVEFSHLSQVRLISYAISNLLIGKPYLVVNLGPAGVDVVIIKNNTFYFGNFTPWQELRLEYAQVADETIGPVLIKILKYAINYYYSRWNEAIGDLIILDKHALNLSEGSHDYHGTVFKPVGEELSFNIFKPVFKKFNDIESQWFTAIGAALRGSVPREKDEYINLKGNKIFTQYLQSHILNFFRISRDVAIAFLAISAILLIGLYSLLKFYDKKLEGAAFMEKMSVMQKTYDELFSSAKNFNKSISWASRLQGEIDDKSLFLRRISLLGNKNKVNLTRISMDVDGGGLIFGKSDRGLNIVNFKNDLSQLDFIAEVIMPLANIKSTDSASEFNLTFRIKK